MKLYIAGPLFTPGDREYIERMAERLTGEGHECFVPHQQQFETLDASTIFAVDSAGLHDAEAVVAWLDGPMIDDGTACEIGIFSELIRTRPDRHRGIVGLATDWRVWRQRDAGMSDGGINFFVGGAILSYGRLVWSIDDVASTLREWEDPTAELRKQSSRDTIALVRSAVRELLSKGAAFNELPVHTRRDIIRNTAEIGAYLAEPDGRVTPAVVSDEVDFPGFVAELISGVFDALIESTIEQMEAYVRLMTDVTNSVHRFMTENVTDQQARDHLAARHRELYELALENDFDAKTVERLATKRQQLLATMVMMGINRIVVTEGTVPAKPAVDP